MTNTKLDLMTPTAPDASRARCVGRADKPARSALGRGRLVVRALAAAVGPVAVALGVSLVGCGDSPAAPAATTESSGGERPASRTRVGTVAQRGSKSVAAEMGAAGGRLELTEGPRVVIPAGAVTEATEFVLQTATLTTAFSNEELEKAVGPTFSFAPGVETAGAPIEVSMPLTSVPEGWGEPALAYEYPVRARVGAEDSVHTKWQYENARLSGGRVTAQVDALPGMRLQFVLSNLAAQ